MARGKKGVSELFLPGSREDLRRSFQPSRIVLAVVPDPTQNRFNILPICFHTWCSYDPLMYVVAIAEENFSSELFQCAEEFVLAIPGEKMLEQVRFCGTHSGRDCDKAKMCKIRWVDSGEIVTPGIASAKANIELVTTDRVPVGDHTLVIGEAKSITIDEDNAEKALLAIGPNPRGYRALTSFGIHTIGTCAG